MIEIVNLKLPLDYANGNNPAEFLSLAPYASKVLGLNTNKFNSITLVKRAIDGRKKSNIHYTATIRVEMTTCNEEQLVEKLGDKNVRIAAENSYTPPTLHAPLSDAQRPVVVGAGCAGLFCALTLARAGARPILLERGADAITRTSDIISFSQGNPLNPESNIQFGAGGAGTFSDGKLTTNTKSSSHRWIINSFIEAGAPQEIAWQAKPHIGSDLLPGIVDTLSRQIIAAGGEIHFHSRMTDLITENGAVAGVLIESEGVSRRIDATTVILATGHSARDVFEMLNTNNIDLQRKIFSMGVRVEHTQATIDTAQFGVSDNPLLPAADYKLAVHLPNKRSCYSFCMCPGGTVVAAASEKGGVVVNGMSEFKRDGRNANSALLVNVNPEDLPGTDVMEGIKLQRTCERAAFVAGGSTMSAPAQKIGDFMARRPSTGQGSVAPTYPLGVTWTTLDGCLPDYILETIHDALPLFAKKLRGFDDKDAVLTGVETRSSSPIRITRDEDCVSVSTPGLIPCGEGAGYAGGIMSAAADGVRCATAVIKGLQA